MEAERKMSVHPKFPKNLCKSEMLIEYNAGTDIIVKTHVKTENSLPNVSGWYKKGPWTPIGQVGFDIWGIFCDGYIFSGGPFC
jgi:hypothetical protein